MSTLKLVQIIILLALLVYIFFMQKVIQRSLLDARIRTPILLSIIIWLSMITILAAIILMLTL